MSAPETLTLFRCLDSTLASCRLALCTHTHIMHTKYGTWASCCGCATWKDTRCAWVRLPSHHPMSKPSQAPSNHSIGLHSPEFEHFNPRTTRRWPPNPIVEEKARPFWSANERLPLALASNRPTGQKMREYVGKRVMSVSHPHSLLSPEASKRPSVRSIRSTDYTPCFVRCIRSTAASIQPAHFPNCASTQPSPLPVSSSARPWALWAITLKHQRPTHTFVSVCIRAYGAWGWPSWPVKPWHVPCFPLDPAAHQQRVSAPESLGREARACGLRCVCGGPLP